MFKSEKHMQKSKQKTLFYNILEKYQIINLKKTKN